MMKDEPIIFQYTIGNAMGSTTREDLLGNVVGAATASLSFNEVECSNFMTASTRAYLLRLVLPCYGFAFASLWVVLSRALPNYIDSGGATFTLVLLV